MPLSLTNFSVDLSNWFEMYQDQFKLYYPLKGGWEAWVQASVAGFIINKDSTIDILREQMIFAGSQQKVDWLLNNDSHSIATKVAIELKCQSIGNEKDFTIGLKADIAKLAQENLKVPFKGCHTAVVGICFTPDAYEWMGDNGFKIIRKSDTNDTACGMIRLH